MPQEEKWVNMKEAAEELGITQSRVSRLAAIGVIKTKNSLINRRVRLVNVEEIRALLISEGVLPKEE